MATHYSPKINTDNLAVYLDANNVKSWDRSYFNRLATANSVGFSYGVYINDRGFGYDVDAGGSSYLSLIHI